MSSYNLKKNDTIKCRDKEDMLNTFMELTKEGYDTDFLYEKDGIKGLWIVILEVPDVNSNE